MRVALVAGYGDLAGDRALRTSSTELAASPINPRFAGPSKIATIFVRITPSATEVSFAPPTDPNAHSIRR